MAKLISDKEVDDVVDVGDGGNKNSQSFGGGIEIAGATAGGGGDAGPGGDIRKPGGFENLRILTQDDSVGLVDRFGETEERVNEGVGTIHNRFHLEKRVGEGTDGDFEITFEGRMVGTEVEFDRFDRT